MCNFWLHSMPDVDASHREIILPVPAERQVLGDLTLAALKFALQRQGLQGPTVVSRDDSRRGSGSRGAVWWCANASRACREPRGVETAALTIRSLLK